MPGIVNTNITATTRFAGTDAAEEQRLRKRTTRLYGRRNYPPEKVADAICGRSSATRPWRRRLRRRVVSGCSPGSARVCCGGSPG
ncbi:Short chain dehydrogenase OS=Streptomyces microflavus OX=1919 GN=Smic_40070 PE=3 SV=1 [Streptomyces microflavus]